MKKPLGLFVIALLGFSLCGNAPDIFQFEGCAIDEDEFWDPNSWDITGLEFFQKDFTNLTPFANIIPIDIVIGKSTVVVIGGKDGNPLGVNQSGSDSPPLTGGGSAGDVDIVINEGDGPLGSVPTGPTGSSGSSSTGSTDSTGSSDSGSSDPLGSSSESSGSAGSSGQSGSSSDSSSSSGSGHVETLPTGDISVNIPDIVGDNANVSVTPGDGSTNILLDNDDKKEEKPDEGNLLGLGYYDENGDFIEYTDEELAQLGYYDDDGNFHLFADDEKKEHEEEPNDVRVLNEVNTQGNFSNEVDTPSSSSINSGAANETANPGNINNVVTINETERPTSPPVNPAPETPQPVSNPPVVDTPPVITPPVVITNPNPTPVVPTTDTSTTLDKNNPEPAEFLDNKKASSRFYSPQLIILLVLSIIYL
jgi:hypothetical protein